VAVTADHRAQVEDLLADYRRSREQLAAAHRALASVRESVASEDGMVTATVGAQGTLTGLVIADAAYQRYRPAELAGLVVRITASAAARAAGQAQRALQDVLPASADPAALLAGRADLRDEEIGADTGEQAGDDARRQARPDAQWRGGDDEESFEHQSWLDGTHRAQQGRLA
jgi:DNA-binding protein YbaB